MAVNGICMRGFVGGRPALMMLRVWVASSKQCNAKDSLSSIEASPINTVLSTVAAASCARRVDCVSLCAAGARV